MSATAGHDEPNTFTPDVPARRSPVVLAIAAVMPAALLGFSALIDPLANFGLTRGEHFGGVMLGGEEKTKFAQAVVPFFLLVGLALAAVAPPAVPARLLRVSAPGIMLLGLAGVSMLWAYDRMQTLQLAAYQTILFASLLLYVAVAREPAQVARWVMAMFALVGLVNLALVVTTPAGPIGHEGIYAHKNTLGAAGGCAFLFGLFHAIDRHAAWRWTARLSVVVGLVLVAASDSKTALALMVLAPALAVGILLVTRSLRVGPVTGTALMLVGATFALLIFAAVLGFDTDDVLIATYGDVTFTGRTQIWGFALDHAWKEPWFGHGYRGFWQLGAASPKHASEIEFIRTIGSGHSGYIDMFLDLGWVGVGLLAAFMLAALSAAGRFDLRPVSRSLLYLSIILFVAGRNAMESVILWSSFFDNLAFLLVAILACYRETPLRRSA